ncbi:MAG: hypothetical protein HQ559_00075 [Lentisphaerae bacterium]|nr:hypothetical protein [Lentisphaerota bacterium]
MKRPGGIAALVIVAALVVCTGCERLPAYTLNGGNVRGTWDFLRASLRPTGILPFPVIIDKDDAAAQEMVGKITFKNGGICEGEFNSPDGGDDTFEGTWETDGADIEVKADGDFELEGKFGVTGDILTVETTQEIEGKNVEIVLQFEKS